MQKNIGTLVPIWSLFSSKLSKKDHRTFEVGLIFLEWLKKTDQTAWQLLPLHETQLEVGSATKHVPSPYKSYGIGLDPKYLSGSFDKKHPTAAEKKEFISNNNDWIHDYTLFCALRDHFHTDNWSQWEVGLRQRNIDTLSYWKKRLAKEIDQHVNVQCLLHQEYSILRKQGALLNISMQGDLPFYISFHSPLVWAHQNVFNLESDGNMKFVSGVPETSMSHFGRQMWGHPLYKWESKEEWGSIVSFWKLRLKYLANLFDCIRFDYASGFFEYGTLHLKDKDRDRYKQGPGKEVFEELIMFAKQNGLSVFVEDSGSYLIEMTKSMERLRVPGVKIFRFAFNEKRNVINTHHADILHYSKHSVVYTTTHDTETLLGYFHNLTAQQKQQLALVSSCTYDSDDRVFAKNVRDAIIASPAQTVVIPIQDWLLTTDRVNIPGTEREVNDPNWDFQVRIPIEEFPV